VKAISAQLPRGVLSKAWEGRGPPSLQCGGASNLGDLVIPWSPCHGQPLRPDTLPLLLVPPCPAGSHAEEETQVWPDGGPGVQTRKPLCASRAKATESIFIVCQEEMKQGQVSSSGCSNGTQGKSAGTFYGSRRPPVWSPRPLAVAAPGVPHSSAPPPWRRGPMVSESSGHMGVWTGAWRWVPPARAG
jgi:hypothetical protein